MSFRTMAISEIIGMPGKMADKNIKVEKELKKTEAKPEPKIIDSAEVMRLYRESLVKYGEAFKALKNL